MSENDFIIVDEEETNKEDNGHRDSDFFWSEDCD